MTAGSVIKAVGRFAPSGTAGPKVADLLSLAASPIFGVMALLTGTASGGMSAMMCSASPFSPLDGMTMMYALMSVFHASPWLRLIRGAGGRDGGMA